jgi:hypothetical protein
MENTNAHKNKNAYIVQNYIRSIVVHVLQWFDLNNIYSREKNKWYLIYNDYRIAS